MTTQQPTTQQPTTQQPTTQQPTTQQPEPDPSDDYGYDLAHEVKSALRIPTARRHAPVPPKDTGRPVDSDGDLGYDDCHDR